MTPPCQIVTAGSIVSAAQDDDLPVLDDEASDFAERIRADESRGAPATRLYETPLALSTYVRLPVRSKSSGSLAAIATLPGGLAAASPCCRIDLGDAVGVAVGLYLSPNAPP